MDELFMLRYGKFERIPDLVVWPGDLMFFVYRYPMTNYLPHFLYYSLKLQKFKFKALSSYSLLMSRGLINFDLYGFLFMTKQLLKFNLSIKEL